MNTSPAMGSAEVHTRKLNDGQGSNIGETGETSGQKIGAEVTKMVIVIKSGVRSTLEIRGGQIGRASGLGWANSTVSRQPARTFAVVTNRAEMDFALSFSPTVFSPL